MRALLIAAALSAASLAYVSPSIAAEPAAAAKPAYSTGDTTIGELIEHPETKAIFDKHLPGASSDPQLEMAKAMTLRQVQSYAPDQFSDEKLNAIDADLAKLKK